MNDKITINEAHFDDVFKISAVLLRCWKFAYKDLINDEYLLSLRDDNWVSMLETGMKDKTKICIVAKKEAEIVGVSILGRSITKQYPNDGEVIALYVAPEYIGQKIGCSLFGQALIILKEHGFTHGIVCTFSDNTRAIRFYETSGFKTVVGDEKVLMGTQELPYVIMRRNFYKFNNDSQ